MKRSKIFLGATTALLAIAGIAAAKAHRAPSATVYYFTKVAAGTHQCFKFPLQTKCTLNGPEAICRFNAAGSLYTLYTKIQTVSGLTTCFTIAKYNAD